MEEEPLVKTFRDEGPKKRKRGKKESSHSASKEEKKRKKKKRKKKQKKRQKKKDGAPKPKKPITQSKFSHAVSDALIVIAKKELVERAYCVTEKKPPHTIVDYRMTASPQLIEEYNELYKQYLEKIKFLQSEGLAIRDQLKRIMEKEGIKNEQVINLLDKMEQTTAFKIRSSRKRPKGARDLFTGEELPETGQSSGDSCYKSVFVQSIDKGMQDQLPVVVYTEAEFAIFPQTIYSFMYANEILYGDLQKALKEMIQTLPEGENVTINQIWGAFIGDKIKDKMITTWNSKERKGYASKLHKLHDNLIKAGGLKEALFSCA